MKNMTLIACLTTLFATFTAPAFAHEFWIEPDRYQVTSKDAITARFRNGEEFVGTELAYFDRSTARLDIVLGAMVQRLSPRNGDRPAISVDSAQEGLLILAHETAPSSLTYKTWEKFAKFAKHKDFPNIEARHMARELPRAGFRERYTRHAKSLIAVGPGHGQDRALGLETEFVLQQNPYIGPFSGTIRAQLFYRGAPRVDAQVEVFERGADGQVQVFLKRTDLNGLVDIPVQEGHEYLLDAVVLRAPQTDPDGKFAWETLWAALTFAIPAR